MTFVEILVAGAIAALTLTVAIMVYATLLNSPARSPGAETLSSLSSAMMTDFYDTTNTTLSVPVAPNYGAAAAAQALHSQLETDIASATAIYSLARNGRSTVRPTEIAGLSDEVARSVITPEDFRQHLEDSSLSGVSGAAGIFTSYSGAASGLTNTSLFVLGPSTNSSAAAVNAVYEMDFVEVSDPPGIYASVRRYPSAQGTTGYDFYHVFYRNDPGRFGLGDTNNFQPPTVFFGRQITTNGVATDDRFRVAENRPFYYLWWPDPAAPRLYSTRAFTGGTNSARSTYSDMAGRTSLFFVIPAFPAL